MTGLAILTTAELGYSMGAYLNLTVLSLLKKFEKYNTVKYRGERRKAQ